MKHVLRACATVVASTALAATAFGSVPAAFAATPVPDGCVGSLYYVCTGDAKPPVPTVKFYGFGGTMNTGIQLVPGQRVDGQPVGGVIVPVDGVTIPGYSTSVGGPTDPVATGVTMPVDVCVYVTCMVAGDPIIVPGLPLPLVPVVVPDTTIPDREVTVPVLVTTPTTTTPEVTAPGYDVTLVPVWVYSDATWYLEATEGVCEAGGGRVITQPEYGGRVTYKCSGGPTAPLANVMYEQGGYAHQ